MYETFFIALLFTTIASFSYGFYNLGKELTFRRIARSLAEATRERMESRKNRKHETRR